VVQLGLSLSSECLALMMLLVVLGMHLTVSVCESRVLCFDWKEIMPVVPQDAGFDFSSLQVCLCDVAAVQRLLSVTECCKGLQCVAVCCIVLLCVSVSGSVLQCDAVCCSVLQCVAVCCSVLVYCAACVCV